MNNILTKIEQSAFLATEADIEAMARDRQNAVDQDNRVTGTYLKILTALTAHDVGTKSTVLSRRRRPTATKLPTAEVAEHLSVLEAVNAKCYGAVMRAVVTPDIAPVETASQDEQQRRSTERNRRTNYARTALAALRAYMAAGGDVRDLTPATTTKRQLRDAAEVLSPPSANVSTARLVRATTADVDRVIEDAEHLAAVDSEQANVLLNVLLEKVQDLKYRIEHGNLHTAQAA